MSHKPGNFGMRFLFSDFGIELEGIFLTKKRVPSGRRLVTVPRGTRFVFIWQVGIHISSIKEVRIAVRGCESGREFRPVR